MSDIEQKISVIRDRLNCISAERDALEKELRELLSARAHVIAGQSFQPPASNILSPEEKIKIFRSLFRGREDVFSRRFESRKTGKSGYQPVCVNEWRRGVCAKPKVKCSECPYREWVPVSDQCA